MKKFDSLALLSCLQTFQASFSPSKLTSTLKHFSFQYRFLTATASIISAVLWEFEENESFELFSLLRYVRAFVRVESFEQFVV